MWNYLSEYIYLSIDLSIYLVEIYMCGFTCCIVCLFAFFIQKGILT